MGYYKKRKPLGRKDFPSFGMWTIGNGAFGYCSALTEITIPASVTSIGEDAFMETGILTTANVPCTWEANPLYTFDTRVNVLSAHTGGTATCQAAAVCSVCGASYGDWFKWSWKFQGLNLILTARLLLFGLAVGY